MYVIFCTTLVFVLYVEAVVGNVIWRTNSNGSKSVNIRSMLAFMVDPLRHGTLWHTPDINYVVWIIVAYGISSSIPSSSEDPHSNSTIHDAEESSSSDSGFSPGLHITPR